MEFGNWIKQWKLKKLHINAKILRAELEFKDADKNAAWALYIELLTRITTQPLPKDHGDEKTALDSIFSIFGLTRSIIKTEGRDCIEFTKIAIVVLNQVIRPFTAKWHRLSVSGVFQQKERCQEFRNELSMLQKDLSEYTKMLADMAEVEDLTELEEG